MLLSEAVVESDPEHFLQLLKSVDATCQKATISSNHVSTQSYVEHPTPYVFSVGHALHSHPEGLLYHLLLSHPPSNICWFLSPFISSGMLLFHVGSSIDDGLNPTSLGFLTLSLKN